MERGNAPDRLLLVNYPLTREIRSRYSDIDSLGHLNNVAIASYYEDARSELNRTLLGGDSLFAGRAFHFVLAEVTIRYLSQARVPGVFAVGIGVGRIGTSSVLHASALFQDDACIGLCDSVMVHMVDDRPAPLPPERRATLESMAFPALASRVAGSREQSSDMAL